MYGGNRYDGDWTSHDESMICGYCEGKSCVSCITLECEICEARCSDDPDDNLRDFISSYICDNCVAHCHACGNHVNTTVYKGCIGKHMKTCTSKQNRAQRSAIVSLETHSIELNKKRIARLRNEIALKQREVEKLEGNLAASKERKLETEVEVEAELFMHSKQQYKKTALETLKGKTQKQRMNTEETATNDANGSR